MNGSLVNAQCGFPATCSNTDYSNFGINSNSNAATIEYDNFVSGFHQTATRTSQGVYKVWGEYMGATEYTDVLIPTDLDNVKYPDLTGTVLKVTLGGDGTGQAIILTTTGLFAMGYGQYVLPEDIYDSGNLTKLTIDGQTDGLPAGVDPLDVKMLFATYDNLVLVTCSGNVYIITNVGESTGTGISGSLSAADASKWYQVTETTAGNPALSNVVAVRGSWNSLFALKTDGTLWTWGKETYLGNNTAKQSRTRATQMTSPPASPIKMIGGTMQFVAGNENHTYYALAANGSLYALGGNSVRQIGDFTTTERLSWVQPRYTSAAGPVMNNVKWISPNEHDASYATINILTTDSLVYNWGFNGGYMLGRPTEEIAYDPGMPNGITNADKIIGVESGGHTTMLIRKCENNFGYVGHSVSGSMGNGGSADTDVLSFSFSTAAVSVCGAAATAQIDVTGTPEMNALGKYCSLTSIGVTGIPAGGTFSVSGPATYNSNNLTFTGSGNTSPSLTYTVTKPGCSSPVSVTRIFNTADCHIPPVANDDVASTTPNNAVAINVLSNDTDADGNITIDATSVSIISNPTHGLFSIDPVTGVITYTPTTGYTGFDTFTYEVCDNDSPSLCDQASVSISVFPATTQCGSMPTCSNTDYSNYGMASTSNAATLEYDNFISSYHSTIVRTSNGTFKLWGNNMNKNGVDNEYSQVELNATNYPGLTGTVLKVALAGGGYTQTLVLTTDGLFAFGKEGEIIHNNITTSSAFQKLTIDGQTDGLPSGINPLDVKMLFGTSQNLVITTCDGYVYIITQKNENTGTGLAAGTLSASDASKWYQVTENTGANAPLSNVVAVRGNYSSLFALKSDGTLWTWGINTYLGDNTSISARTRATQMILPTVTPIKMIGVTSDGFPNYKPTYYLLQTNGVMYSLGFNNKNQIGDFTTTDRLSWTRPKRTSGGALLFNVKWISPNEHSYVHPAINVLTSDSTIYNWGENNAYMLGRPTMDANYDPGIPASISADKIIALETGGHTTLISKKCENHFGYVGHVSEGSIGNGNTGDSYNSSFTFLTNVVSVCGVQGAAPEIVTFGTPTLNSSGKYCNYSSIGVNGIPSNGTLSLTSGPATLNNGNLTFTGSGNTAVTLTYTVTNAGCPNPVSNTRTFNTADCNIPPVATNDVASTPKNTDIEINVLSNDTDSDGTINATTVRVVTGPTHGTLSVDPVTGKITYTPTLNYLGSDAFTYEVCDNGTPVFCDQADVAITVIQPNVSSPIATDDIATTNEDAAVEINVIANDTDPDGTINATTVSIVTGPTNGTLSVNPVTGKITYTPTANYSGSDAFTYQVCDNGIPVLCDQASVSITVNAVNDGPTATDDVATVTEDTPLTINVVSNDTDLEGVVNATTVTIVTGPTNGTLSVDPVTGQVTYTPAANYSGSDAFKYQVCDNGTPALCDQASVSITVTAVNDNPIATDDVATTNEDTPVLINVPSNDTDVEGTVNVTTVSVVTGPTHGTLNVNSVTGQVTYTPEANYSGTDAFTYSICENGTPALCDQASVSITVNAVNDTPIATDDLATVTEDTPLTINVVSNDTDLEGVVNATTVTIVTGPTNGTLSVDPVTGQVTYTPATNYSGTDAFTYQVCDNGTPALCDQATVSITVNAVNDGPIATDDLATTSEDTPVLINVPSNDTDVEGTVNITTVSVVTGPSHGSLNIDPVSGKVTYTPAANYSGSDSFTYQVCDNGTPALCDQATVTITVTAVNDGPIATDDVASTTEDTPVLINVPSNDTDIDGTINPTTVSVVTGPTHGSLNIDPVTGKVTYTPAANYVGSDAFTYQVCDNGTPVICDQATVTITVTAVNDGPTATDDVVTTTEDTPLIINAVSNDTDPDGTINVTSVSVVSSPTHGTLSIDPVTGKITYTPSLNYSGSDVFTYSVCDNGTPVLCDQATVTITVTAVNDGPIATDDTQDTNMDTPVVINVASNDTDIDGTINVTSVTIVTGPTHGTVSVDPLTGKITYTPNSNYSGSDVFTYLVCDNGTPVLCDQANVVINIGDCFSNSNLDCDGDGVTNGQETTDGTDSNNPCEAKLSSQSLTPSNEWKLLDCDTDGITNGVEISNGSNPFDHCSPNSCDINVIEAFTPDGDGINETFVIDGLSKFPDNEITILNRWGNKVFHTVNYQNDWNGISQNDLNIDGDALPTGTYYYVLDTKDSQIGVLKGYIYLQR